MYKRFLAVLTALVFIVPAIVGAQGASKSKGNMKAPANVANKSYQGDPPEKVNEPGNVMEKTAGHKQVSKNQQVMEKTAGHKRVSTNQKVMERNTAQKKQANKVLQGTVNE